MSATVTGVATQHQKATIIGYWLGVALPYLFLLFTSYWVFAETVDDPYITFRYAANLTTGHGPVFNVGEHVEGFTSPLHVVVCALLLKVAPAIDILFKAKLVSLFFAFILLYQSGKLARTLGLSRWECLTAQSLLALNVNLAIAAVNGLETTIYACLVMASIHAFICEGRTKSSPRSAGWLFLALLTRPDACLIFITLLCVQFLYLRRGETSVSAVIQWSAIFLMPALALTTLRWNYYGSPLPNTFYAKHVAAASGLREGLQYLTRTLSSDIVGLHTGIRPHAPLRDRLFLFDTLLFWGLAFFGMSKLPRRSDFAVFSAMIIALFALVLRTGGDWMPGWRFVIAYLPFLAVAQCFGIRRMISLIAQRRLEKRTVRHSQRRVLNLASYSFLILCWALSFLYAPHYSWASIRFSTQGKDMLFASPGLGPTWVVIGDYIHQSVPAGEYIAYSEMGYAGFTNMDKKFLDIRGLTNREIARMPSSLKSMTGVSDPLWLHPGDPIASIVQRQHPGIIIDLGGTQMADLFHRQYRAASASKLLLDPLLPVPHISVSLYVRDPAVTLTKKIGAEDSRSL